VLLAIIFAAAPCAAQEAVRPFEAAYVWVWHGLTVAESTLKLEREGDHWIYTSHSTPRGIGRMFSERPSMRSVLRITPEGVQPLSYKADDGTSSTKRAIDVVFDWEHKRIIGVYEDTPLDMPTQPEIQDDLSVQIALLVNVRRGHVPGKLELLDKNQVREYNYQREDETTLPTVLGPVDTIVLKTQKTGSPRFNRYWCAPGKGFVPMKVEQTRGDEVQWTMQIERLALK